MCGSMMGFSLEGKWYRVAVVNGCLYVNDSPVEQYPLRIQAMARGCVINAGIFEP